VDVAEAMLLAIDAGNSNIVFAVFEGERLRAQWRAGTGIPWDLHERELWLRGLLAAEGLGVEDLSGAVLGSVVEPLTPLLIEFCQRCCGLDPVLAERIWPRLGLPIRVDQPERVGVDRIANAVAAHRRHSGASLVIDFGTATKFDVVGADGGYEGGAICAGFMIGVAAMHRQLARVPAIVHARPQAVVGRSTEAAARSGAYWGYVALVEGLVQRIGREYDRPLNVIATGGLAALLAPGIRGIDLHAPDLTLEGLRLLYWAVGAKREMP